MHHIDPEIFHSKESWCRFIAIATISNHRMNRLRRSKGRVKFSGDPSGELQHRFWRDKKGTYIGKAVVEVDAEELRDDGRI